MTLRHVPLALLVELIARAKSAPTPARVARAEKASAEIMRRAAWSARMVART